MAIPAKQLLDKCITDKNGKVVIGQFPNLPLMGWLICIGLGSLVSDAVLKAGFAGLGSGFLFVWAYLELTEGVTYLRQFLGVLVMAVAIVGFFS